MSSFIEFLCTFHVQDSYLPIKKHYREITILISHTYHLWVEHGSFHSPTLLVSSAKSSSLPSGEDCSSAFLKFLITFTSSKCAISRCTKHKSRVGAELTTDVAITKGHSYPSGREQELSMGLETSLEFVVICCLFWRTAWFHIDKFPGQQMQNEQIRNIQIQSSLRTSIFLCFYLILQLVDSAAFLISLTLHKHPSFYWF